MPTEPTNVLYKQKLVRTEGISVLWFGVKWYGSVAKAEKWEFLFRQVFVVFVWYNRKNGVKTSVNANQIK